MIGSGFADPVQGSQACFRAVLDAIARPGRVHRIVDDLTPPAPLSPAAAAVLLTLVDQETALCLDPRVEPARDWIAFHCGAPFATAETAAFALSLGLPDLAQMPAGTDEEPETSATVVVQLASLTGGTGFRLTGPGLSGASILRADGLPDTFAAAWADNHALYPRGVDLILCAGRDIAALPRSIRVEAA